jgi:hypothetical protein
MKLMDQFRQNPVVDLGPCPEVSKKTILMSGLLVDVYGLGELSPTASNITCLWLHHGRTMKKEDMADTAARCVAQYNSVCKEQRAKCREQMLRKYGTLPTPDPGRLGDESERGLIALAFDARNHGTRLVDKKANLGWPDNQTHAQDMLGMVSDTASDQIQLLDAVGGYLFLDEGSAGDANVKRVIQDHIVLGVSLGGHLAWQLMFMDSRIRAGIIIIGCPDLTSQLSFPLSGCLTKC